MKRVYHPTLASFQDVPDDAVDEWAEAGWRKTPPKHIDTELLPEVGSGVVASAPSEVVDYGSTTTTTAGGTTTTTATTAGSAR